MYLVEDVVIDGPPAEWWRRFSRADGAWVRRVAVDLAEESGSVHRLLGFPPNGSGRALVVDVDVELRPGSLGGTGAVFVSWVTDWVRLEGELTVIPVSAQQSRLRFVAAYEPAWAAIHTDRVELQRLADDAGWEFIDRIALAGEAGTDDVDHERLCILVEDEDTAWHQLVIELAGLDDYEFETCSGPRTVDGGCPVLSGAPCPKVERADVILNSLDSEDPANRTLLALQRSWPGMTVTALRGSPDTTCFTRHTNGR